MNRVKRCDKLWAEAVKARAGYRCEYYFCGATERLQAHHVIPRTNYATRYLVENGVCLCYKHHFFLAHKDAMAFTDWFRANRSMDADMVERERNSLNKNDYQKIEDRLKEYLKAPFSGVLSGHKMEVER